MSDSAPKEPCNPCPAALEPAELISDGTCRTCLRYTRMNLVLILANLLLTIAAFVLCAVQEDSSRPAPKPSPTATATPSSPPPTDGSSSGGSSSGGSSSMPSPSETMLPPDTNGGGGNGGTGTCNIFDPECGSGTPPAGGGFVSGGIG